MTTFTTAVYSNTITTYLKHPSIEVLNSAQKDFLQQKSRDVGKQEPTQTAKTSLELNVEEMLPSLSGFIALYGGYLDYSNMDGRIALPRRHNDDKLYVIVTPTIKTKTVYKETIGHLELMLPDSNEPIKIYKLERKEEEVTDKETEKKEKVLFWTVSEETIPEDKKINPLSVVILTRPENLFIPTGDFMTTDNPNLILPNIYVVGNMEKPFSSFDFMDIKKYFEPVEIKEEKKEKKKLKQQIILNE